MEICGDGDVSVMLEREILPLEKGRTFNLLQFIIDFLEEILLLHLCVTPWNLSVVYVHEVPEDVRNFRISQLGVANRVERNDGFLFGIDFLRSYFLGTRL